MLEKRARRVFTRKPLPSGVISGIITTSANICAHEFKVGQAHLNQLVIAEIALQSESFRHRVRDRCAGQTYKPAAALHQVPHLHEHIERTLRVAVGKPSNTCHLRVAVQILKHVQFVDYQHVNAHLIPCDRIGAVLIHLGLVDQLCFEALDGFLDLLAGAVVNLLFSLDPLQEVTQFFQFFLDKLIQSFRLYGKHLEGGLRNDYRIPFPCCNTAHKLLALPLAQVILTRT